MYPQPTQIGRKQLIYFIVSQYDDKVFHQKLHQKSVL